MSSPSFRRNVSLSSTAVSYCRKRGRGNGGEEEETGGSKIPRGKELEPQEVEVGKNRSRIGWITVVPEGDKEEGCSASARILEWQSFCGLRATWRRRRRARRKVIGIGGGGSNGRGVEGRDRGSRESREQKGLRWSWRWSRVRSKGGGGGGGGGGGHEEDDEEDDGGENERRGGRTEVTIHPTWTPAPRIRGYPPKWIYYCRHYIARENPSEAREGRDARRRRC